MKSVNQFDTDIGYDFVRIYSPPNSTEVFSGSGIQIYLELSSIFNVTFTSDSSVTRSGFELMWTCAESIITFFRILFTILFRRN